MRFAHLHLENWRNFIQVDTDLALRTFLVGPNASGKSNLLEAFRFLHDVVSVGGGFRSAVENRRGVARIRCLAARRNPDVVLDVGLGNGPGGKPGKWRYRLAFGQDNQRLPILKEESVWQERQVVLKRPNAEDQRDPERLRQTHLEQINANREFREVADFFATVRYLHLVPQLLRDPDRSVGKKDDPFGGDFLQQIARAQPRTRDARVRRIGEALKVAVPQLEQLEFYKDEKGTPHLRGLYKHWRPSAGWQTEEQFSDGTLRLLGLLWAILDGEGPLLLEEPELSLHPEVIRHLPAMFSRIQRKRPRQVLISTHSPELLQDQGIAAEEVLLLTPSNEGTRVVHAAGDQQIRALLEGGATVAEAVIPRTRPLDAHQLTMFGE